MKRSPYKKYMEDGILKSTYYTRLKKNRQLFVDEVQNADVSIYHIFITSIICFFCYKHLFIIKKIKNIRSFINIIYSLLKNFKKFIINFEIIGYKQKML